MNFGLDMQVWLWAALTFTTGWNWVITNTAGPFTPYRKLSVTQRWTCGPPKICAVENYILREPFWICGFEIWIMGRTEPLYTATWPLFPPFCVQKVTFSSPPEIRLHALMFNTAFVNIYKLRALTAYSFPVTIHVDLLTSLGARITLVIKCSIARVRVA